MTESVKVEEKCKPSFEKHCELWGYNTELDEDGFYVDSLTQRLFNAYHDAWQASRAALVVKLPVKFPENDDKDSAEVVYILDVLEQLSLAGVRYE